jgi:hypothetical protein
LTTNDSWLKIEECKKELVKKWKDMPLQWFWTEILASENAKTRLKVVVFYSKLLSHALSVSLLRGNNWSYISFDLFIC